MELPFRRSKLSICIGVILTTGYQVNAAEQAHNEDTLEEIVITSAFNTSEAETAMPIGILSGEALREKVGNSLGATLQSGLTSLVMVLALANLSSEAKEETELKSFKTALV